MRDFIILIKCIFDNHSPHMNIELEQIVPIPLKDRFSQRNSDVWNTHVQFSQGEFIKIKAPSGTGKTTLVHLLYKLRYDYEGTIRFNKKPLNEWKEDELAGIRQQNLSIIFQDLRLSLTSPHAKT